MRPTSSQWSLDGVVVVVWRTDGGSWVNRCIVCVACDDRRRFRLLLLLLFVGFVVEDWVCG